jgi:hypothetical protein
VHLRTPRTPARDLPAAILAACTHALMLIYFRVKKKIIFRRTRELVAPLWVVARFIARTASNQSLFINHTNGCHQYKF